MLSRQWGTAPDGEPDPVLPDLSRADARWLIATAIEAFAAARVEVVSDGAGALCGMDGRRYGLANLSLLVSARPRRRWRREILNYVRMLLEAEATPRPTTLEELGALVVPRVLPTGALSAGRLRAPRYAPELAPDLHVFAALDHPTHVATLAADDALDDFGGWPAVAPYAEANLRRLPRPHHEALAAEPGRKDSLVHTFWSDDSFGASRALMLEELLAPITGIEAPEHGVLFVIPNRTLLAAHVIAGPGVVGAAQLLAQIAQVEYRDAGQVSPYVYYRPAGKPVEQITHRTEAGSMEIDGGHTFGTVLEQLGLLGR